MTGDWAEAQEDSPRQGLASLTVADRYRTGTHDLLSDFYVPCLTHAIRYDRAVGFFTTGSIALAAQGLSALVERSGRVRLVASPRLNPDDVAAIVRGYKLREDDAVDRMLAELSYSVVSNASRFSQARLHLVTWMVAHGILDLRVALIDHPKAAGIYHEKLGLVEDAFGNTVAFSGSSNESIMGIQHNFESFNVFRSWITEDERRVREHRRDFDRLWDDETVGLRVLELPQAVHDRLIELAPSECPIEPEYEAAREKNAGKRTRSMAGTLPTRPQDFELRDYQKEAIVSWLDVGYHGIWSMATGSGKTVTALSAMSAVVGAMHELERPVLVVIVVPYRILVDQWKREIERFGVTPVLCYGDSSAWVERFLELLAELRTGSVGVLVAITTNATFAGDYFQAVWDAAPRDVLLIADEVHNLGAPRNLDSLPGMADMRLGLSATPLRHRDTAGSEGLLRYFGEITYEFGLRDALDRGFLTPYRYFPIQVALTDDEAHHYLELTEKISRLVGINGDLDEIGDGPLKTLLFRRARLIGGASNKLAALEDSIAPFTSDFGTLVYCSDATFDGVLEDLPQRQLEAVVHLLGRRLGMHVHPYTSREDDATRTEIERRFRARELAALVAIRCLDEGVDLPDIRRAFILASTTNPRQFIQRRGRVLRRAPGKDSAEIYDFVVVPPPGETDRHRDLDRRLFRRELERVVEFASSASNGPQALNSLLDVRRRYDLLGVG